MATEQVFPFSVASVVEEVLQQHGVRPRNIDLISKKAEEDCMFFHSLVFWDFHFVNRLIFLLFLVWFGLNDDWNEILEFVLFLFNLIDGGMDIYGVGMYFVSLGSIGNVLGFCFWILRNIKAWSPFPVSSLFFSKRITISFSFDSHKHVSFSCDWLYEYF